MDKGSKTWQYYDLSIKLSRGDIVFDINIINNIKDIENIKVDMLENISQIYSNLKIGSNNENIDIKENLIKNIELTKQLAQKLNLEV